MACPNIPVMMCQKHKVVMMHKVGDAEAELLVKRLIYGRVEVSSEAGIEGISWEDDMVGEIWACVAALRDEGGIDL